MFKWILKRAVVILVAPIVDTTIEALEKLAQQTSTKIDDDLVAILKKYRSMIINYILGNVNNIIKKTKD